MGLSFPLDDGLEDGLEGERELGAESRSFDGTLGVDVLCTGETGRDGVREVV